MNIIVTDPHPNWKLLEELNGKALPLHDLLREADVVSLRVPLTPETFHMISRYQLRLMKGGACLINTPRGRVVDEGALMMALKEGWISGAALDVYEVELPTNLELIRLPNVVCTPHIGSMTREAQELIGVVIAEKVINALTRAQ